MSRGTRAHITEKRLLEDMTGVVFDARRARNMRDEAPRAYKGIEAVMRAQHDLVRRIRVLHPLLNHRG